MNDDDGIGSPAHRTSPRLVSAKPQTPTGASSGDDVAITGYLIGAGIIVGLVLAFLGVYLLLQKQSSLIPSFIICVGFGILLVSFGARARGSWAGWTASGAGAMAIGLFLLLMHYTPNPNPNEIKHGQIRGDLSKIADLRIVDEEPFYEFRDRTIQAIRFIVVDKELRNPNLQIQVDTNEKGEGREFFEMIGDGKWISDRYLSDRNENSGDGRIIKWTLDYDKKVVTDGEKVILSVPTSVKPDTVDFSKKNVQGALSGFNLISPALADGLNQTPSNDISKLVEDLKSDEPSVRRNSRDGLVAIGVVAIPDIMREAEQDLTNYRVKSGAVYILAEILRKDVSSGESISQKLQPDDFSYLTNAASDKDPTIRLQATQFLYNLHDPRAVPESLKSATQSQTADGVYNNAIIAKGSAQKFSDDDKGKLVKEFSTLNEVNENIRNDTNYKNNIENLLKPQT